jgi:hypothetical protein
MHPDGHEEVPFEVPDKKVLVITAVGWEYDGENGGPTGPHIIRLQLSTQAALSTILAFPVELNATSNGMGNLDLVTGLAVTKGPTIKFALERRDPPPVSLIDGHALTLLRPILRGYLTDF